ncbi:MAG: right-handed parallel beta-helix repeat-containing protein [Thermoleophilaceae bacterium]
MERAGNRSKLIAGIGSGLATALVIALAPSAHVERDPVFQSPEPDASVVPAAGGDFVQARTLRDPARGLAGFRRYATRHWDEVADERRQDGLLVRFARLSESQQRSALSHLAGLREQHEGPGAEELGLTDARLTAEETIVVCRPDSMERLRTSVGQETLSASPRRDRALKRRLIALNEEWEERCAFEEIQPAVNAADNGDTVVVMPGFYTEPTARAQPHNDPRCADLNDSGTERQSAPSYEYHVRCPNDLSLIAVIGRDLEGNCVRCNVQIHGSGVRPEDVLLEGAEEPVDPGVSNDLFEEGKGQVETAKEIGFRFERTDGAYIGNMTVRNVSEHGFYSIETDGITFDRVKAYYAHEYGHLSFVTDHLLVQDGDFAGSSDAGVYPGASPPSGERLNSIIRRNRSHHNAIGLSGSMGSSLLIEDNEFDTNSTGITLDSISRAGHPGYPQNSSVIRQNRIHSNNFDTFSDEAWVESSVPAPIGVGVLFAGGNTNTVSRNHIYGNWRWGTGLITVPDILTNDPQGLPEDLKFSTSHGNRYLFNTMGVTPAGAEDLNGIDFWWDELGEGNCWEENSGPASGLNNSPQPMPECETFPNIGLSNVLKEAELLACNFGEREPGGLCPWYSVPPKPSRG